MDDTLLALVLILIGIWGAYRSIRKQRIAYDVKFG